jgi:ABC-type amino acid transport substrate-binding protein
MTTFILAARRGLLPLFLLIVSGLSAFSAQADAQTVRVGLFVSPPFVMQEDGHFTGMAFSLWASTAARAGFVSQYHEFSSTSALLDALHSGKIDVAVTNLSITQERAQHADFSFPWYDGGLRIMTRRPLPAGKALSLWEGLTDAGHITFYLWLTAAVLLFTVVLTLVDRRLDKQFPRSWFAGLAESFYHVMMLITSGKTSHKPMFGSVGRIISALWLVCGVAIIAGFTSSLTSIMTTRSLEVPVSSVRDLAGRTVGVRTGSEAEHYLQTAGIHTRTFNHLTEAIPALQEGSVDAIVADAPVLEYFVHTHPDVPVSLSGPLFHPDKYGFAFPPGSTLSRPISLEVIAAHEQGELTRLRTLYFGYTQ